ncbi:hypothetical protein [Sporisorium scitamineum]|uniref:Uncharacterized protein n=1 Tax=Sporisorium scitamineum TaxID=49012 RepID=A0A0F7S3I1_9BASI|nr:hypothetical protein [Sporisorium scitamineum]
MRNQTSWKDARSIRHQTPLVKLAMVKEEDGQGTE